MLLSAVTDQTELKLTSLPQLTVTSDITSTAGSLTFTETEPQLSQRTTCDDALLQFTMFLHTESYCSFVYAILLLTWLMGPT